MKKALVIAALAAALGAAGCATTPGGGGGGGGIAAGCYDSNSSALSIIYSGPIASYKNAQLATNSTGCGSNPINEYVTIVLAADQSSAIAECQAGPDPAADAAAGLAALGFDTLPANGWFCTNPLSGALLHAGECFAIGTASVEYLGPRNSVNNAALHQAGSTTCSSTVIGLYTYVQQSSQAAALAACVSVDPVFVSATSLVVIPTIPNDTYLCAEA